MKRSATAASGEAAGPRKARKPSVFPPEAPAVAPEQGAAPPEVQAAARLARVRKGKPVSVPQQDLLQAALGYTFVQPELLQLALTHSSFIYEARLGRAKTNHDEPNQPGTDNEQLEFLGDAVLGLAVTELLLREFPGRSEGELTRIRASLVSRKRMAEWGAELALGDALRMGKSAEAGDGRRKAAVLANAAEALIGAMYLDVTRSAAAIAETGPRKTVATKVRKGRSVQDGAGSAAIEAAPGFATGTGEHALLTVRQLLLRAVVAPDLPAIRAELAAAPGRGAMRDAKSRLQERVQAERAGRLHYADVGETGPAHARSFRVEARLERYDGSIHPLAVAEGGSKKEAQQLAAADALTALDELSAQPAKVPIGSPSPTETRQSGRKKAQGA